MFRYQCKACHFSTDLRSNYLRHCGTQKHAKNINRYGVSGSQETIDLERENQKLKNENLVADAPKDAIFALGAANRILAIVPSRDLIMVRLGDFPKDSNFQSNIWLKF